jgi:hypothetical protein
LTHLDLSAIDFDVLLALLIQSSKLSKILAGILLLGDGAQSPASTPMKRPRRVLPSLFCLAPPTAVAPNWATITWI